MSAHGLHSVAIAAAGGAGELSKIDAAGGIVGRRLFDVELHDCGLD